MKKINIKKDFLTNESTHLLLSLLDKLDINYCVIDNEGNHMMQNGNLHKRISYGAIEAEKIDLASWQDCQWVMRSGKTKITEEYFEDKTYLSVKQPMMQDDVCLGLIVLSIDITAQKDLTIKNKKIEQLHAAVDSMVDELHVPLRMLSIGMDMLENHMPALLEAYQYSIQHNPKQTKLSKYDLVDLEQLPNDLSQSIKECSVFISMHLKNMREGMPIVRQYQPFWLNQVLEEAIDYYCFTDDERHCIKLFPLSEVAESFGDYIAVKHVFWNLFKNAVQAIKVAGKGKLHIWMESKQDDYVIHVKDTALGMSETIRHDLFHSYLSQPTTNEGLGLAYCLRTMRAMGGQMHCDSKEGKYTHIMLVFPAYKRTKTMVENIKMSLNDESMNDLTQALTHALAG